MWVLVIHTVICSTTRNIIFGQEVHMNNFTIIFSYTLAAMSGICFVTGLAVLSGGKRYGHRSTRGDA